MYKNLISPLFLQTCRFNPSCSSYMMQAITKHGAIKGFYLGSKRILRCHPFNKGGWDPIPEKFNWKKMEKGKCHIE